MRELHGETTGDKNGATWVPGLIAELQKFPKGYPVHAKVWSGKLTTDQQRKLHFGKYITAIVKYRRETGDPISKERLHDIVKRELGFTEDYEHKGEIRTRVLSVNELTAKQMSELIDWLDAWTTKLGIPVDG